MPPAKNEKKKRHRQHTVLERGSSSLCRLEKRDARLDVTRMDEFRADIGKCVYRTKEGKGKCGNLTAEKFPLRIRPY